MVVVQTGFAPGVTLDATQVKIALEKMPTALYHNLRKAMIDIAAEHSKRVKTRFKSWTPGQKPVPTIQLRDGALRNAVQPPDMRGSNLESLMMQMIVSRPKNNRPYAEIQETGGPISKKTRRLTIPFDHILDKRGKVRPSMRIVPTVFPATKRRKISRRGFRTAGGIPTFIWTKGGRAYVAINDPKKKKQDDGSGQLTLLYSLRDSVQLHPRLQFRAEWNKMREFQQAAFDLALQRTVAHLTEGT